MGMSDEPFEVMCPDCGAMLKIDPVTRAIIAHQSAPKKKMFEDFGEAARALPQHVGGTFDQAVGKRAVGDDENADHGVDVRPKPAF